MKYVTLSVLLMLTKFCMAQDSAPCVCTFTYSFKYPRNVDTLPVCDTVFVEFDINEDHTYHNPTVSQDLGEAWNEAILKSARLYVARVNECVRKCIKTPRQKGKTRWPVIFKCE